MAKRQPLTHPATGLDASIRWRVRAQRASTSHPKKKLVATVISTVRNPSAPGLGTTVIAESPTAAARLRKAEISDMMNTALISNVLGQPPALGMTVERKHDDGTTTRPWSQRAPAGWLQRDSYVPGGSREPLLCLLSPSVDSVANLAAKPKVHG